MKTGEINSNVENNNSQHNVHCEDEFSTVSAISDNPVWLLFEELEKSRSYKVSDFRKKYFF